MLLKNEGTPFRWKETPMWQTTLIVVDVLLAVLVVALELLAVKNYRKW